MTGICQDLSEARADYSVTTCLLNKLEPSGVYTARVTAKSLGGEIKRLREEKGWTLPELARRSGVDKTSLNRIELGKRQPHRSTLKSIVSALTLKPSASLHPRLLEALDDSAIGGAQSSSTRPEDRLRELLDYIATLEGKARTDFLAAIAAVLDVAGYTRAATGSNTAQNDGR